MRSMVEPAVLRVATKLDCRSTSDAKSLSEGETSPEEADL